MENSNIKFFFHKNKQKFPESVCDINSGTVNIKLNQPYSAADLRDKKMYTFCRGYSQMEQT